MRAPADSKEVWVVYDRLWRSKNWVGSIEESSEASHHGKITTPRDGRVWEQDEHGVEGEALGVGNGKSRYGDGKHLPMHLRKSHREFVDDIGCDNCSASILERCEQCSVFMHCAGCRKTLCASCAFDRPYTRNQPEAAKIEEGQSDGQTDKFWWAPGFSVSPCSMQEQDEAPNGNANGQALPQTNPASKFKWCCTEPVFSGGGGITFGPGNSGREFERMRAAPLPRGDGWEDPEFQLRGRPVEETYLAQDRLPASRTHLNKTDHYDVMHQLLGPGKQPSPVPRNLCDECYSSQNWKVKCRACVQPICLQHDLRGLKMRVCGYRDLPSEKEALGKRHKSIENMTLSLERLRGFLSAQHRTEMPDLWHKHWSEGPGGLTMPLDIDDADSTNAELGHGSRIPPVPSTPTQGPVVDSEAIPSNNQDAIERPNRPTSPSSNATAAASRSTSPAPSVDSAIAPMSTPESGPEKAKDAIEPHPKWSGCLSFACPQFRGYGDHRPRCTASFRECEGCKVNVCKACADKMPKPCRCDTCVESIVSGGVSSGAAAIPGTTATIHGMLVAAHPTPRATSAAGIDKDRFWCPNCRWERVLVGRCKAERQKMAMRGKGNGKEKQRKKSTGSSEETIDAATNQTGIEHETAEHAVEPQNPVSQESETVLPEPHTTSSLSDGIPMADPTSIPAPPPLPPSMAPEMQTSNTLTVPHFATSTNAEERDLERISAMVDDLQTRIDRLRAVYASRRQQGDQSDGGGVAAAEVSEDVAAPAGTVTGAGPASEAERDAETEIEAGEMD